MPQDPLDQDKNPTDHPVDAASPEESSRDVGINSSPKKVIEPDPSFSLDVERDSSLQDESKENSDPTPDTEPSEDASPASANSLQDDLAAALAVDRAAAGSADPTLNVSAEAPEEPDNPTSASSDSTTSVSTLPPAPGRRRRKLVIGSIIAAILVVLGGGSVLAYSLWYQNPNKVVTDAVVHALEAKTLSLSGTSTFQTTPSSTSQYISLSQAKITLAGKATTTSRQADVTVDLTIAKKDITLNGSGIYDKDGNLYVKVSNLKKTLNDTGLAGSLPEAYARIVTEIDGRWIKISADDLRPVNSKAANVQKCIKDTSAGLANDRQATDEIVQLYKEDNFLTIDPINDTSVKGSLGYNVATDTTKARAFINGLNDTKVYKALQQCDNSIRLNANDIIATNTKTRTTAKVWVSRWGHELTKVEIANTFDDKSSLDTTLTPEFDQSLTITPPGDPLSLKDLQNDINKAEQSYQSSLSANSNSLETDSSSSSDNFGSQDY